MAVVMFVVIMVVVVVIFVSVFGRNNSDGYGGVWDLDRIHE